MPARHIIGVTPQTLPNEVGQPALWTVGTATMPDPGEILIDAAGEGGVLILYVPSQWRRIGSLLIRFRGMGAGIYNFSLTVVSGDCTEAGDWAGAMPATFQVTTTAGGIYCYDFDMTAFPHLPGHWIRVTVDYSLAGGGGLATNLTFLGAHATES